MRVFTFLVEASGLRLVLDIASPSSCSGDKATRPEPISQAGAARKSKKRPQAAAFSQSLGRSPAQQPSGRSLDHEQASGRSPVQRPQPAKALHCVCRNCSACWNKPVSTAPLSKPAGGGPPPEGPGPGPGPLLLGGLASGVGLVDGLRLRRPALGVFGVLAVAPARLFFGLVLALGLLGLDPGLLHWSVAAALLKTGSKAAGNASQPRPCTPPSSPRSHPATARARCGGRSARAACGELARKRPTSRRGSGSVARASPAPRRPPATTGGGPAGSAGRTEAVSTASARLPRSSSLERSCSASTSAASSDSLGPEPTGALSTGPGASAPLAVAWPSPFPRAAAAAAGSAAAPREAPAPLGRAFRFELELEEEVLEEDGLLLRVFFFSASAFERRAASSSFLSSFFSSCASCVRLRKAGLRVWGLEFAVYRVYRLPASGFRFGSAVLSYVEACHPGRSHGTHPRQRPRQAQEPAGPQPQYAPARKPGTGSHLGRSLSTLPPASETGSHLGRSRSTLPDRPAYSKPSAPSGPQPQYARKTHARKPNPIRHFQGRINRTAAASPSPRSWRLGMAKLQALR